MGSPSRRRISKRARKIAVKVGVVLADPHVRAQASRDRLEALESDTVAPEPIDLDDDEDASPGEDEDEPTGEAFRQKGPKVPKSALRRKTRRAKAIERSEISKKAPKTFLSLIQEADIEASLSSNVPTYLRAAVGPPSSHARRHFCSVCGYLASYTCTKCGTRFCSCRCKVVHDDTKCQKFVI
jgi:zinc finger HIT domain-containing protein 1